MIFFNCKTILWKVSPTGFKSRVGIQVDSWATRKQSIFFFPCYWILALWSFGVCLFGFTRKNLKLLIKHGI